MTNFNPNTKGLIPAKKGEQRALKPEDQRKTELIAFKATKTEREQLEEQKSKTKHKKLSAFIREKLGL